ncbi:MAG: tRNA 2-thiouridine(34) synthase MnmA [Alloprevotella sp.]|nr:tRNA 2-thiouridine(34) synthase MnmA [Alloprevotella sp.]
MRTAGLISGGVDSAVAVYLLKEQGITPDLYYIKIGSGPEGEWDCKAEEDWEMATSVAHKYGCRLELIDLQREYWDKVVGYIVEQLRAGLTPNSDVMCNKYIKFGVFEERVGKDYDRIATGHYARTETDEEGRVWLTTSPDPVKDQTDFLAQISNLSLQKLCFPIGHLMKDEVRRLAEQEHLAPARRHDSQGICFLGKIRFSELARRYLGEKEGLVVEKETGNIIGKHKGYWFFTIGQRKGLGFGGGPWYVVGKDIKRNIVYISKGFQTQAAYGREFRVKEPLFLTANPFATDGDYDITFKVRHTPEFVAGRLMRRGDRYHVVSAEDIQGLAPGQFAVLYDKDAHRCYGSGEIRLGK